MGLALRPEGPQEPSPGRIPGGLEVRQHPRPEGPQEPSPGSIPGGVQRPNHPRPVGPQERIPGASKVSITCAVTGRKNPLAPVATPVTVRNFAQDWDRVPPALQAGGLWPVGGTQGFSLGWVPAALQAAGGRPRYTKLGDDQELKFSLQRSGEDGDVAVSPKAQPRLSEGHRGPLSYSWSRTGANQRTRRAARAYSKLTWPATRSISQFPMSIAISRYPKRVSQRVGITGRSGRRRASRR